MHTKEQFQIEQSAAATPVSPSAADGAYDDVIDLSMDDVSYTTDDATYQPTAAAAAGAAAASTTTAAQAAAAAAAAMLHNDAWSPQEFELLVQLRKQGLSYSQISTRLFEQYGIERTKGACQMKYTREFEEELKLEKAEWTKEQSDMLIQLRIEGHDFEVIAQSLSRHFKIRRTSKGCLARMRNLVATSNPELAHLVPPALPRTNSSKRPSSSKRASAASSQSGGSSSSSSRSRKKSSHAPSSDDPEAPKPLYGAAARAVAKKKLRLAQEAASSATNGAAVDASGTSSAAVVADPAAAVPVEAPATRELSEEWDKLLVESTDISDDESWLPSPRQEEPTVHQEEHQPATVVATTPAKRGRKRKHAETASRTERSGTPPPIGSFEDSIFSVEIATPSVSLEATEALASPTDDVPMQEELSSLATATAS